MLRDVLRPVAAVGVLACAASLLLTGGTSSATAPTRPAYGPVAAPVVVPLVDARGPLLPRRPTAPVAAPPAVPGPDARAAAIGPPVAVGPGSTPAQVRAAQRLLNRAGAGLRVDGDWGPATTRAVRAVQARAGLPADGRLGPATVAHLRRQP